MKATSELSRILGQQLPWHKPGVYARQGLKESNLIAEILKGSMV